jgi:hypothetical protein
MSVVMSYASSLILVEKFIPLVISTIILMNVVALFFLLNFTPLYMNIDLKAFST